MAPVSCLHLHKDCLVFMLQLYGVALLGRKETPNPIKLHGYLDDTVHSVISATTF